MRFQPGTVHPARYQTPYGALELSVETDYLGWELSHSGGRVMIRYRLSAQGQSMGQFTLQLHVRPAQAAAAILRMSPPTSTAMAVRSPPSSTASARSARASPRSCRARSAARETRS